MGYRFRAARRAALAAGLAAALSIALPAVALDETPVAASGVEIVMVEQPGCFYCYHWHEQIGPAYPKTRAGAYAPLRSAQLRDMPGDLALDRRVVFTPTFLLVDQHGTEIARLEGYPGDNFFWPLFERMLIDNTDYTPTN